MSQDQYTQAVLYSAASLWAKTSTQDIKDDGINGSKKHTIIICNKFIESILTSEHFDNNIVDWLKMKGDYGTFGLHIVENMLHVGELNEIGFDSKFIRLSLPEPKTIYISRDRAIIKGLPKQMEGSIEMSGLSIIKKCENLESNLNLINSEQWVLDYINSLKKTKPDYKTISSNDKIFDPTKHYNEGYTTTTGSFIPPYQVILREIEFKKEYYIRMEGGLYHIDNRLVHSRDFHRFEFYLMRTNTINKVTVICPFNKKIFQLNLFCALPSHESSLIRSVMWPKRNIQDLASFYGPTFLTDYIKTILESLGLKIKCQN